MHPLMFLVGIAPDHVPIVAVLILVFSLIGVIFGAFAIGGDE